ncbi:beta-ketoacyl-[acyl-carrier-protein] synthase family protein [Clostridium estertheticum]|uniref:beta-ketoacyl-[acyl-carrier-protein] synthase family protein n=1 Tax=Clostridium estertheticum TaxID=238834 RepID=UPI001C7CFFD1|nr:beta-ketoacyl-[acyl-carrier-protein] synthase family protein [Clostridium estertheticum]MBX4266840.1 beta-ketoacyl-[acyl-carrier-protein] synthase family protein [Clostridium estertheticum]WLC89024.1 beta-ketoacyl-[acyl-carrier-protein] synthase family protein [Clostridium estertheticum]
MYNENKTVITGMGMVNSLGLNVDTTWKNLLQGKCGVKKISLFDASNLETQIAAEVSPKIEEIAAKLISKRERKHMTRTTRMALVAVHEAIMNSSINFDNYDRGRVAVIMGVMNNSYNIMEKEESETNSIVKSMTNALPAWISLHYGLEGPSFQVSTACASSAYAISLGHQMIKAGLADAVIVGGADSSIEADQIKGFNQIMALSVRNDSPETACRPFSLTRDGFIMGEGAGVLVLESEKSALKRNAFIYGEVAGYAITSEATNITAPKENGVGMAKTMRMALADARVNINEIDYINAHGTSTYLNDKYETFGIKECFGESAKKLAVSSSKSMTGHTVAAAGAIEGIISILSINNKIITPTINYKEADPELDLDYVPNKAREKDIRVAISNSFGFGGHNATIVYKKY